MVTESVVVVEDDDETRNLLARSLRQAGLHVLTAAHGKEGLDLIRRYRPAVVLLDLVMPGVPGQFVCSSIRAEPETAETYIIMLTGLGRDADRIAGFELGADDYVTKPCNMRELVLRVEAALRRTVGRKGLAAGPIRIDGEARRAWVEEVELSLTVTEFALLLCFVERPGKLFTREELLQACWGGAEQPDQRCVDAHIKRLRHKLGGAADAIQTVHGSGYRLSVEGLLLKRRAESDGGEAPH